MKSDQMIPADEFCVHHKIELPFIYSLHESGLIQFVLIEEALFIPIGQLSDLEKIVRLYYDLDVNLEGIETILHLLKRINTLHEQVTVLANRLNAYES